MNSYKNLKKIFVSIFAALLTFAGNAHRDEEASMPTAGGDCEYKIYEGRAKIVSITPRGQHDKKTPETFEVKFIFIADRSPDKDGPKTEGKEFTLLLDNSRYPGSKFLKKNDIQTGRAFDCEMKIITKGACTPVVFEFATLRLNDYCEQ